MKHQLRSSVCTNGRKMAGARALWVAAGMKQEQFGKPLIEFEDENAPAIECDDSGVAGPTLDAPMGGTIIEILVKPGDHVKKGQEVIVYEAMKMQNNIESEIEGIVKKVLVNEGDVISANQPLIEFKK